jgi:hypothetical protein
MELSSFRCRLNPQAVYYHHIDPADMDDAATGSKLSAGGARWDTNAFVTSPVLPACRGRIRSVSFEQMALRFR